MALGRERGKGPHARRQRERGSHRNIAHIPARGIKQQALPLHVDHVGPQQRGTPRREKLEIEGDRLCTVRHMDAEGMAIDGITMPFRSLPVDAHDQSGEFDGRRGRGMASRFPLGIEQNHFARVLRRDRLVHGEDLVIRVRGGDGQSHCTVEWAVARRGKRCRGCNDRGPDGGDRRLRPS